MSFHVTSGILLLDILLFTVFLICVLVKLGIPDNLSITYYLFKRKKLFFPVVALLICLTGGLLWISMTYNASPWCSKFVIIPILSVFCLLAVIASTRYKRTKWLTNFHYACAITASVGLVLWINLVAYKIAYVGAAVLLGFLYAGIRTKTLKTCPLFWLEVAAFYSLLVTLLVIDLLPSAIL